MEDKEVLVSIRFPRELWKRFQKLRKKEYQTDSEGIRDLVRRYVEKESVDQ